MTFMENIKIKIVSFLRWSEKYTKTDMLYLAKGGFWLTFGQFASTIIVFILAVAFGNLLKPETYGIYKYVIYLAGILGAFTLTGMNTTVAQAVARGFDGTLKKAFWVQIKWNSILLIIGLITSLYYYLNNNLLLSLSLLVVALLSPILNSANTYTAFLNGKKSFRSSVLFSTITSAISASAVILTLFITKEVFWIILIYFLVNSCVNLFFYIYTASKLPENNKIDNEVISYGKYLSFVNIITTATSFLDGILVFQFLGVIPLAIYSFAIAPIDQIKGLLKKIPTLVMPKLTSKSLEEIDDLFYQRISQLIIIGLLVSLLYIFFSPYFFRVFFPQYLDSIPISQLYSLILIPTIFLNLFGARWQAKLNLVPKKILYKLMLAQPLTLIILLFILTPLLGINGVILSRLISATLNIFIDQFYWKKMLKLQSNSI